MSASSTESAGTVDDLVQAMQDVLDLETVKTRLEGLKENATGGDADILNKQMEAVEKALTLSKEETPEAVRE